MHTWSLKVHIAGHPMRASNDYPHYIETRIAGRQLKIAPQGGGVTAAYLFIVLTHIVAFDSDQSSNLVTGL